MPFKKIIHGKNKGKYRSESGKIYTKKQRNLYYLTKGFRDWRKARKYRGKKK